MAQGFAETAHLKSDRKKLGEGFDRIARFAEYKAEILNNVDNQEKVAHLLKELESELDSNAVEKMTDILRIAKGE